MECRYCFDTGDLIFPCNCRAGIHEECLKKWLSMPPSKVRCEICLQEWDKNKLSLKTRCAPYYGVLNWSIMCVSLYFCLLGSFVLCNFCMDINVLQTYAILEVIFHALFFITCTVFSKKKWFSNWAILRMAFTMWPCIYITNRWFELNQFDDLLFISLFYKWQIMGAIQCIYLIVMPIVFLKIRERPRQDWVPMRIEVM